MNIKNFTVLGLLLCATSLPMASTADGDDIGEEFRQTLLRLAQAGELPAGDTPVFIERPAERVPNFGLLIDRDNDAGLLVLGTLPGGSAEQIGLQAGDRLLAANNVDLTGPGGSVRMRGLLDEIDDEAPMAFRVLRDGREERLAGTVEAVALPAMRVELIPANDTAGGAGSDTDAIAMDHVAGDPDSSCGRISTFPVAPRTRQLFSARLIAVDGELPGPSSQDTFRIAPGRHVLTVAEAIDPRYFQSIANQQRSRQGRRGYKDIEIDVRPGVTYLLAARFHLDRSSQILDGGYWEPVIWKERAEACR